MTNYYLQTYGCQMNFYEADTVRAILNQAGYQEIDNETTADIVLLFTCSVREHAEKRALGRLKQLVAMKKSRNIIIGVLGCMAECLKDILITEHHADFVVGPDQYLRLPELIAITQKGEPQLAVGFTNECYAQIHPLSKNPVTAFVSIIRGCSNYCSYCIVPYVKGPEKSRPKESVLEEIRELVSRGVKEITLLGQNVLAYRDNNTDFCQLLKMVCSIDGIERVRFLTSHPRDLDINLLLIMKEFAKICPQLHLPLQSGSNRVLQLMNRGYTRDEYLQKITAARQLLPEISLTTDIIVGFPTECDEEFEETIELIKTIKFDYAYMFKFSPRPGTRAAELQPAVPAAVIQQRLAELIKTQNRITRELNQVLIGKEYLVLIEQVSPRGNGVLGKTAQGKVVILDQPLRIGSLVRVMITELRGWTPIGKIVEGG